MPFNKAALKKLSLPPGPWLTTLKNSFPNPPALLEIEGKQYPYEFFKPIINIKKGFRLFPRFRGYPSISRELRVQSSEPMAARAKAKKTHFDCDTFFPSNVNSLIYVWN